MSIGPNERFRHLELNEQITLRLEGRSAMPIAQDQSSSGAGTPFTVFTTGGDSEKSRRILTQSSMHSSQMNAFGPAISLPARPLLLPQTGQPRIIPASRP